VRGIAHWDDVEPRRRDFGHIAGAWRDIGRAAGTFAVGVKHVEVDAGKWSTPAHVHGAEEEIFYVLGGSGLSWQDDGRGAAAYELRAGDCIVHRAEHESHTLRAGADGLVVLAFGMRAPAEACFLPRSGAAWLGPTWVDAGGGQHPYAREADVGEPDVGEPMLDRPPTIVNVDEVEGQTFAGETVERVRRNLGQAAGSERTGLQHVVVAPGKLGAPPHCHSAEEEIFVVLAGTGTFVLGGDEHEVRSGHVVARPPGSGLAHAFRAGAEGLTYLAYGTREPNDVCYYPRSQKLAFRGVGVIGRIQTLDYWDGER
jgi:uncharacterized cupin superfamily protein